MTALIAQESTFQADVRSVANAYGLMQIDAGHRPPLRAVARDPAVPDGAAHGGRNQRPDRDGVLLRTCSRSSATSRRHWRPTTPATPGVRWLAERPGVDQDEFIDDIPFPETQNYVKRIIGTAEDYRTLYRRLQ